MTRSRGIDQYLTDIVFRPGNAVGLAYLRNPRDASATRELIELLNRALPGVDARIDPKVDHLLLKLPESTLRQVNEYAGQNCMMEDHRPAAAPESRPRGLQVRHFIVETERRFRHWGTSK